MSGRDPLLRLPSWLIAASLVVLVVATLTYFVTSNNDNTDEAAPSATSPSDTGGTSASDDSETADNDKQRPDQKAGTEPKDSKPDAKKDRAKPADEPRKHQPKRQAPPESSPDATVDVYNNAGITNLAASASADVRSAGFTIGGVDNWYGSIPETTVYYPQGMEEQARLLAGDLGVSRTMPAISPMSAERLSLILTAAL